ncbi:hypothetical protein [Erythrobacter alti]|uniref:hypothetical protein n=1 Tax=Erythrobacter alti TaxID=1896145 RepID=UPI0030F3B0CD
MLKILAISAALAISLAGPVAAQDDDAPEPRNTRGLPGHLHAIDDMLRGGLLNDPTDLNWEHYGLGRDLVVDESYPGGGAALRIAMGPATEVYAGGVNIPLLARVNRGEQLTIGFFARTIESSASNGNGRVSVRFQINEPPYAGYGDTVLEIGREWGFYEVTSEAERPIRRNGIVALQFGLQEQVVEIGQAIVVTGTRSVFD